MVILSDYKLLFLFVPVALSIVCVCHRHCRVVMLSCNIKIWKFTYLSGGFCKGVVVVVIVW